MMAVDYTTLESVKKAFLGTWKDDWDEWVNNNIPLVSEILRQLFVGYNRDLNEDIIAGKTSLILVESVANNMIIRMLNSGAATAPGMPAVPDYQSFSANAGPYGFSITPASGSGTFYVRPDEKRLLGLPRFGFTTMNFRLFETRRPNVPRE